MAATETANGILGVRRGEKVGRRVVVAVTERLEPPERG